MMGFHFKTIIGCRRKIQKGIWREECEAMVSDKNILEATVSQLNGEIQVKFTDLDAPYKGWELDKDYISSTILETRHETIDITKIIHMVEHTWNIQKRISIFCFHWMHKRKKLNTCLMKVRGSQFNIWKKKLKYNRG